VRIYWTKEEEKELKYYYEELGLSLSEIFEDFIKKYPHRTKTALEIKINKLKLRHTKEQISNLKSRLNSGEKNGMFGKIGPNLGLTKENSERIKISSEKISKTRKELYKDGKLKDVSGSNNPMFEKDPWNKWKNKDDDIRLKGTSEKMSIYRKNIWYNLSQEDKNIIINKLALASIKARKNTKIEMIIKRILEKLDINFIKEYKYNKYIFDFYLLDYNFVIECQGDYWHGNTEYFKILNDMQLKNIDRDKNKKFFLIENNISSLFLWENEIYKNIDILEKIILESITEIY